MAGGECSDLDDDVVDVGEPGTLVELDERVKLGAMAEELDESRCARVGGKVD